MVTSYYDIPLINHWLRMEVVHKKEEKKFFVKSRYTGEKKFNDSKRETEIDIGFEMEEEKYFETTVKVNFSKSGYNTLEIVKFHQNQLEEYIPLAREQANFSENHVTWEVKIGDVKKRVVLNLGKKELYLEGVTKVTSTSDVGAQTFKIDGHASRLEKTGGEWNLEVKDCQVEPFKPRNGPNKESWQFAI